MDFINQKQKTAKRFVAVNAEKLRDLRLSHGWSQSELARRSGYSARLIRKAESGGSLNYETIEDLAITLSTEEVQIPADQLTCNPKEIVQHFLEAYDAHGSKCVEHFQHVFAPDIELHCSADVETFPFAGSWKAHSGIAGFFAAFFGIYERRNQSIRPKYLVGDSCVVARFSEVLIYRGHELPAHQVCWYCEFYQGKIIRIEYEYDQYQAARNLRSLLDQNHQRSIV